eukprot:361885-Chlamydomonas_euryale.AAC.14
MGLVLCSPALVPPGPDAPGATAGLEGAFCARPAAGPLSRGNTRPKPSPLSVPPRQMPSSRPLLVLTPAAPPRAHEPVAPRRSLPCTPPANQEGATGSPRLGVWAGRLEDLQSVDDGVPMRDCSVGREVWRCLVAMRQGGALQAGMQDCEGGPGEGGAREAWGNHHLVYSAWGPHLNRCIHQAAWQAVALATFACALLAAAASAAAIGLLAWLLRALPPPIRALVHAPARSPPFRQPSPCHDTLRLLTLMHATVHVRGAAVARGHAHPAPQMRGME